MLIIVAVPLRIRGALSRHPSLINKVDKIVTPTSDDKRQALSLISTATVLVNLRCAVVFTPAPLTFKVKNKYTTKCLCVSVFGTTFWDYPRLD